MARYSLRPEHRRASTCRARVTSRDTFGDIRARGETSELITSAAALPKAPLPRLNLSRQLDSRSPLSFVCLT